jgi:hypothetical protein
MGLDLVIYTKKTSNLLLNLTISPLKTSENIQENV